MNIYCADVGTSLVLKRERGVAHALIAQFFFDVVECFDVLTTISLFLSWLKHWYSTAIQGSLPTLSHAIYLDSFLLYKEGSSSFINPHPKIHRVVIDLDLNLREKSIDDTIIFSSLQELMVGLTDHGLGLLVTSGLNASLIAYSSEYYVTGDYGVMSDSLAVLSQQSCLWVIQSDCCSMLLSW